MRVCLDQGRAHRQEGYSNGSYGAQQHNAEFSRICSGVSLGTERAVSLATTFVAVLIQVLPQRMFDAYESRNG